jgi:hypothetical protein
MYYLRSFLTMFGWKDLLYYAISINTVYILVALVMLVVWGEDIHNHFERTGCSVDYNSPHSAADSSQVQAIFFASIGAFLIGTRVFKIQVSEELMESMNWRAGFFLITLMLTLAWGFMTVLTVYTGSCASIATDTVVRQHINGEINMMSSFGGLLWSLLLAIAINDLDVVPIKNDDDTKSKNRIIVLFTHSFTLSKWALRLILGSLLVALLDDDDNNNFYINHGNKAIGTEPCTTAITNLGADYTDSTEYKTFERIELAKVDYATATLTINTKMHALAWTIVALAIVELFLRLNEIIVVWKKERGVSINVTMEKSRNWCLGCAKGLAFVGDIIMGIFLAVLVFENEIAACPLLDPKDSLVKTIHWMSVLYIFHGVVSALWKEYKFHGKIDPKVADYYGISFTNAYTRLGKTASDLGARYQ